SWQRTEPVKKRSGASAPPQARHTGFDGFWLTQGTLRRPSAARVLRLGSPISSRLGLGLGGLDELGPERRHLVPAVVAANRAGVAQHRRQDAPARKAQRLIRPLVHAKRRAYGAHRTSPRRDRPHSREIGRCATGSITRRGERLYPARRKLEADDLRARARDDAAPAVA